MPATADTAEHQLVVCYGTNAALRASATNRLVAAASAGDRGAVEHLDAAKVTAVELRTQLSTPNLFGDTRVIVLRADSVKDEVADVLRAFATDPTPGVSVIVDTGRKPAKLDAKLVDANPPRQAKAKEQYIADAFHRAGVRLTSDGLRRISDLASEDLARVEPLALIARDLHGGTPVNAAAIDALSTAAGDVPPWELTDAIANRRAAVALRALHRQMSNGRHALAVLATLRNWATDRFAVAAHRSQAGTVTADDVKSLTGKSGFAATKLIRDTQKLTVARAATDLERIAAADGALKGGGGLDELTAMTVLVARLAL